jgi:hypothetical protein
MRVRRELSLRTIAQPDGGPRRCGASQPLGELNGGVLFQSRQAFARRSLCQQQYEHVGSYSSCQAMGIAGIPGYHPLIEYPDCALTALLFGGSGTLGPCGPSHNQTYDTGEYKSWPHPESFLPR